MPDPIADSAETGRVLKPTGSTWIESDRILARGLARPVRKFLHIEIAGGIVLLAATVVALVWANSPWSSSYEAFWSTEITLLAFGEYQLADSLSHWVNDGLMVIFFFVVGLEIKTELVTGELRDPRKAAVPAVAAIGGMVVPAAVFLAFNSGGDGAAGWGIPMATDIAFALGVLALLGPRIPSALKVFLLTLAIVDDVGAIAVIAFFYTNDLSFGWLAVALTLLGVIVAMRIVRVWYVPLYVLVGVGVWLATFESGIHATIAGVALGVLTPAIALRPDPKAPRVEPETSREEIRGIVFDVRETVPMTQRLQDALHPFSSFLILPTFALANAGIEISRDGLEGAATSPITLGIVAGLVIGKIVGITCATWLATRLGIGTLPAEVNMHHVTGAAALAGIGFTVAIFITGLAYDAPAAIEEAKLGVLAASLLAAVVGAAVLSRRPRT